MLKNLRFIETDALDGGGYEYETRAGDLYFIRSPHTVEKAGMRTNNVDGVYTSGVYPANYKLYNKNSGEFIKVFCSDFDTTVRTGKDFRRLELEQSPFFDKEAAGMLRTIMLKAYPIMQQGNNYDLQAFIDTIAKVITWNDLSGLTQEEAVTGVQMAVWKYARIK